MMSTFLEEAKAAEKDAIKKYGKDDWRSINAALTKKQAKALMDDERKQQQARIDAALNRGEKVYINHGDGRVTRLRKPDDED
jgi:hypothetical protein